MAVTNVIKFRQLVSQLTGPEIQKLFLHLLDSKPNELIHVISLGFMRNSRRHLRNQFFNQYCNSQVACIIRSRDPGGIDGSYTEPCRLDGLPRRLIGHIASYLEQSAYLDMSVCNRLIHLGCNTPITLTSLDVHCRGDVEKMFFNPARFPYAAKMRFSSSGIQNLEHLERIRERQHIIASQIAALPLLRSLDLSDLAPHFVAVIAQHLSREQGIQQLRISPVRSTTDAEFVEALSLFCGIHRLDLYDNDRPLKVSVRHQQAVLKSCRNLTELETFGLHNDCVVGISLLRAIHRRLRLFSLAFATNDAIHELEAMQFPNLRELRLRDDGSLAAGRVIVPSARFLERVQIIHSEDGRHHAPKLIQETIISCSHLRVLDVYILSDDITRALEAIDRGLAVTKDQERDYLKLRFGGTWHLNKEVVAMLDTIFNVLQTSKVDQWMIILPEHAMNWVRMMSQRGYPHIDFKLTNSYPIVTNSNCTINGHDIEPFVAYRY